MTQNLSIPSVVDANFIDEVMQQRPDVRLIDVRTPSEFESMHIPGSYNVPLDLLPEHRHELTAALSAPAVLVCRSGARARQAAQLLQQSNLTQLHILEGGLVAWQAAGKPVQRGQQRWSLERQVRGLAGTLVLAGALGSVFVAPPLLAVSAVVGAGLAFSAVTDTCGMAMVLAKLPYNRGATCDMREVVSRLAADTR
jgi:rhodanese-related sulfurtransferase